MAFFQEVRVKAEEELFLPVEKRVERESLFKIDFS